MIDSWLNRVEKNGGREREGAGEKEKKRQKKK